MFTPRPPQLHRGVERIQQCPSPYLSLYKQKADNKLSIATGTTATAVPWQEHHVQYLHGRWLNGLIDR